MLQLWEQAPNKCCRSADHRRAAGRLATSSAVHRQCGQAGAWRQSDPAEARAVFIPLVAMPDAAAREAPAEGLEQRIEVVVGAEQICSQHFHVPEVPLQCQDSLKQREEVVEALVHVANQWAIPQCVHEHRMLDHFPALECRFGAERLQCFLLPPAPRLFGALQVGRRCATLHGKLHGVKGLVWPFIEVRPEVRQLSILKDTKEPSVEIKRDAFQAIGVAAVLGRGSADVHHIVSLVDEHGVPIPFVAVRADALAQPPHLLQHLRCGPRPWPFRGRCRQRRPPAGGRHNGWRWRWRGRRRRRWSWCLGRRQGRARLQSGWRPSLLGGGVPRQNRLCDGGGGGGGRGRGHSNSSSSGGRGSRRGHQSAHLCLWLLLQLLQIGGQGPRAL
mmetsp:Transcript_41300/g.130976  ORF Transcript_41300/g.130976 Transcript_41300/m.130976 type:complete len:388 (-) Transcript_41300:221-1384(-)